MIKPETASKENLSASQRIDARIAELGTGAAKPCAACAS